MKNKISNLKKSNIFRKKKSLIIRIANNKIVEKLQAQANGKIVIITPFIYSNM